MNVLITSGGTDEKIDAVRSILNTSTGELASLIADSFSTSSDIDEIFYVCTNSAVKPLSEKVNIICIDTVDDLEHTLKSILSMSDIDIIIHGMAVSDYRMVISLCKFHSPQATLVGFKLLDNVLKETLINKGYQLLLDDQCSFVLANDSSDISECQHIGYLIDRNKNYSCYRTKLEIANAITAATLKEKICYDC